MRRPSVVASRSFTEPQLAAWRRALDLWGVQLHPPRSEPDAGTGSFAWFSFPPQVAVDLVEAERHGVADELETIFAHEIGHHVLSPSTRVDGLLIRQQIARALHASLPDELAPPAPTAALLANLWSDLLINDRVAARQRTTDLDTETAMVRMWRTLAGGDRPTPLWWLVLRTYELLWELPPVTLCAPDPPRAPAADHDGEAADWLRTDPRADAVVLAETVRGFADDPVRGALRFGMIVAPYAARPAGPLPVSVACAGDPGGGPPSPAELDSVLSDARLDEQPQHPLGAGAEDPTGEDRQPGLGQGYGLAATQQLWHDVPEAVLLEAWYAAAARRWVRPLRQPADEPERFDETIPGAHELWELHDEMDRIDWPATLMASPQVVPGVTTRQRTELPDAPPRSTESVALDLYIDSSGSMRPPQSESPAVLAGMILLLSTLRGGGRARVTSFSGPGEVAGTERFSRDRTAAVAALLHFYAGGTTFPLDLLARRYERAVPGGPVRRHLVVLSDDGLASMFGEGQDAALADVAARVRPALTTATLVLAATPGPVQQVAEEAGYRVAYIETMADAPAVCTQLAAEVLGAGRSW